MKRLALAALIGALATACNGIGAYQPWPAHVSAAAKPASPLRAPEGSALLVVIQSKPQGSGNGRFTVFERSEPVAQFDEETASWTAAELSAGEHQFYVRTWASDFCTRVDATVAAGKVYVLDLNPQFASGPTDSIFGNAAFRDRPNAGALALLPYVATDRPAAAKELTGHARQLSDCIEHANAARAKAPQAAHTLGFDEIDFTTPGK